MDYFSSNKNKYMLSSRSDLPRKETNIYLDILWYNRGEKSGFDSSYESHV